MITADVVRAGRCIPQGARVLKPKRKDFTADDIGNALATRALLEMLRQSGDFCGGPVPFAKPHRSRLLSRLDQIIQAIRRASWL